MKMKLFSKRFSSSLSSSCYSLNSLTLNYNNLKNISSNFILKRFLCLSHIDKLNKPTMVNITTKENTLRIAHARCYVYLPQNVVDSLTSSSSISSSTNNNNNNELISKKGPVLTTSIIAGVMACKKTSDLIPFCHPISIEDCQIKIEFDEFKKNTLKVDCIVQTRSNTGVEMEAFVGASNAALCIYDMCKAASHDIKITDLQLISKTGGKRDFFRNDIDQNNQNNIDS